MCMCEKCGTATCGFCGQSVPLRRAELENHQVQDVLRDHRKHDPARRASRLCDGSGMRPARARSESAAWEAAREGSG